MLRDRGRGNNKDWSGCRGTPKAEIESLPEEGPVARGQAWGSGTVE